VKSETKGFIVGGILILFIWFLYINYTYMMPEQGGDCIEEMQKCKESSKSVYTHFEGM
jgi:hypothetical protein